MRILITADLHYDVARSKAPTEAIAEEMRLRSEAMAWLNMPLGFQAAMFDNAAGDAQADPEHAEWAAGEAGLHAGTTGELRDDNP